MIIFITDRGSHTATAGRQPIKMKWQAAPVPPAKKSALKIHGNVLYDVNYYSNLDTPYAQQDVYQHTVQAYLDITVKDHYPMRLFFTTRFGNARLLKSFNNVNLLFNSYQFQQTVRDRLKEKITLQGIPAIKMDSIRRLLDIKYQQLSGLRSELEGPGYLQRQVEIREREYLAKRYAAMLGQKVDSLAIYPDSILTLPGKPSFLPVSLTGSGLQKGQVAGMSRDSALSKLGNLHGRTDSLKAKAMSRLPGGSDSAKGVRKYLDTLAAYKAWADSLRDDLRAKKGRYDSLKQEVKTLEATYSRLRALTGRSGAGARKIDAISNVQELKARMQEYGIPDSAMPKGYKSLMAVRSVGLGTNVVNYSELSLKNIMLTGLQVEYNPSWYVAFAAGTLEYRFRDFVVQDQPGPRQYAGIVRVGRGMKDGNNIILSYYAGRRQLYSSFSDTVRPGQLSPYLMGFTIEGNYRLGVHHLLTVELAKSSMPVYQAGDKSTGLLASALSFKDHSNEAYSLKLASYIPSTQTQINGYYKRLGTNFQSFSIFTNGAAQRIWNIRVSQRLFKRTVEIVASANENDFTNPYIPAGFKSTTVFKSIQATYRKNKWPVISLGYFPSSQLTRLSEDRYLQNMFYNLTASLGHYYRLKDNTLSTSLIYTQFYNSSKDSGFVYFNTKNLLINQSLFLPKLTLQFNLSRASNTWYRLYTTDGNAQYTCNKWLSVGGGLKYNLQTAYDLRQVGYSGNAAIKVPLLGEFRFLFDKGFIPGPDRRLEHNNIGRFTYFKTF
ncbi:hypothetical protein [Foetidibacter luteolus]|uniref:hypothetical protein n=1 Tax=Foetidibacter luteolus TaxID=2608880 RepID=UPI00129A5FB1|nr:hypothetical protein [Foetidibacter luteolus]